MDSKAGLLLLTILWLGCSGTGGGPVDADGVDAGDGDVIDADSDADLLLDADDADGVDAELDDAETDGDEETETGPACRLEDLEVVDLGHLELEGSLEGQTLEPCSMHRLSFAVPEGTEVEIDLTPMGMYPLAGAVTYPDAAAWDTTITLFRASGYEVTTTTSFVAPRSGEFMFLVRSPNPLLRQRYNVAIRCVSGCERETTRYPIVLVHGWTGFDEIGPLEYFYEIPGMLTDRGYQQFVAVLDPYNSVEVRSGQLAAQVDEFLEAGRARKINIIAHSQGGLDSRRLISTLGYGDRVSALVTFATPHQGTPVTDVALGLLPGAGEEALFLLLNLLGASVAGSESDAEASFYSLSQEYVVNEFNPSNPDDERVSYISWTGRTCLFGISCDDICDIEIRWSYDIIYLLEGPNDGMVPVSSAPWGDYRGEVPADHFDEVGQLFGITGAHFEHEDFYLERARDLAAEGH